MNILIAGSFLFPSGSAPAIRMHNLAKGFADNKANVHLLPLAPIFDPNKNIKQIYQFSPHVTYEITTKSNHPVPARNKFFHKPFWLWHTYLTALRAHKRVYELIKTKKYDLFIGYGRNLTILGPLVKLCKNHNIITLLDIVELSSQFSGFGNKFNPIYWDWYFGERLLPHQFDGLMVIAHGLQALYETRGATNFLHVPAFEDWSNAPLIKEKQKNTNHLFQLVGISTLLERDAPKLLLDTMRVLGQQNIPVQLNLVGKFREVAESRTWIHQCETDPYLQKNVNLIGKVSDTDLKQQFDTADGFILTRRNETTEICSFPTRLVEYLKVGRPVFVSAVGDIPFYLEDKQDVIFLSSNDPYQSAQAIANIVTSPERGIQIGLQGQLKGKLVFNREVHAKRIINFAKELMIERCR